jgi:hypothetical protein
MPPRPPSDPGALSRGLAGAALLLTALHLLRFSDPSFTLDDAWISFRVARTWWETGLLTFDASRPPVEGMTNLLWTLLSAIWVVALPRVDPIGPARLVGALCHLGALLLLMRAASRLAARWGGRPLLAAGLAGLLSAASGSAAFHAMSGLETPLCLLLLAGALERGLAALEDARRSPALLCGLCLGLGFATRPEGALLGLLLLGVLALRSVRTAAIAALPFGAVGFLVQGFRLWTWGQWLPNTFYAKPPSLAMGLGYVADAALYVAGGGLALLALLPALRHRLGGALLAAILGLALAVAWSGGDWMPGFRRLETAALLLHVLVGASLSTLRTARGVGAGLGALGLLGMLGGSLLAALHGRDAAPYPYDLQARLGEAAARTPEVRRVATFDIGRFGWAFPGSIFDLGGLTDTRIGRSEGVHGEKKWDEAYFREQSPELAIATALSPLSPLPSGPIRFRLVDQDLVLSIQRHGGYRLHVCVPVQEDQWVLVFRRLDVVLDPTIWGDECTVLADFLTGRRAPGPPD